MIGTCPGPIVRLAPPFVFLWALLSLSKMLLFSSGNPDLVSSVFEARDLADVLGYLHSY
jgi:hypothetical protein